MIVHIRCTGCGHRFRDKETIVGQTISCPRCGRRLKVEAGTAISGAAMSAKVSLAQPLQETPKPPSKEEGAEESAWRQPAVWIGLVAVVALVTVFVVTMGRTRAPSPAVKPEAAQQAAVSPPPDKGSAATVAPSTTGAEAEGDSPSPGPSVPPPAAAPTTPAATHTPPPTAASVANLPAEDLFKQASPAVVRIVVRDEKLKEIGLGSGFFVSSDGILVTNYHVVDKARYATVLLPSDAMLFVEGILAVDEQADLAVLKVNGKDLPSLSLLQGGQTPAVGVRVYAIGNPQGLSNTLSEGLISGVRMIAPDLPVLQITAAISPGSSGGPVLDSSGQVVGVATAILAGPLAQNLNFAVPSNKVHEILAKAHSAKPVPLDSAGGNPMTDQSARDLEEALSAMNEERWKDAVDIIQRLRQTDPSNPQVWCVLGFLHLELANYDLAFDAFQEAVRVAPDHAVGYFGVGAAYAAQNRHAEAVRVFRTAVRLSPEFWPAHVCLAGSLYQIGQYLESAKACREAIRVRPDAARAYYVLTLDYLAMGNRTEALRIYETVRRLDPLLAAELRNRLLGR